MGIPHRWRTSDGILDVRFPYTREMVDRVRTLTIGDPRDIRTIAEPTISEAAAHVQKCRARSPETPARGRSPHNPPRYGAGGSR